MKKTHTLLLCLCAASLSISAQHIWHKKMPNTAISAAFIQLTTDGEHYFLHSDRDYFQLDKSGTIIGYFRQPTTTPFWSYAGKRYASGTGNPYFLMVRRVPASVQGYTVAAYLPGTGFVNETNFPDSLGTISWRRPQLVAIDDSISVVFGRKFIRKIQYTEGIGFTEIWSKPLDMPVTVALRDGNRFVVADEAGNVAAFDENGDLLWSQNHAMTFMALKKIPGGFIGSGRITGGTSKGAYIMLNDNGGEVWKKIVDHTEYRDITTTADGNFALTGVSQGGEILLMVADGLGQMIWEKEYGPGAGASILSETDGGFVVAARTTGPIMQILFKTDENGNTSSLEDVFIRNRRIRTESVEATLDPSPSLFFDGNDSTFKFDSVVSVFTFAPWVGGLDDDDSLHISAADYYTYPNNPKDYRPGLAASTRYDFERVWAVDRASIAALRKDFGEDHIFNNPVPFDLLTWPGKGNPNLQYNLDFTPVTTDPALFPAPFVDVNGDGIYNVYDGDYPRIRGDQMAWWVLTDSTAHSLTQGKLLNIDLMLSAYAYDCPQNGSVDHSLFLDVEAVNRSGEDYHDTHLGFFTDFDLGCFEDDYIGSMADVNGFYVYNIDNMDINCQGGALGFGENIPVQTVSFLNRSLDHSMFFNNPSIGVPPPATTDPDLPGEFFNFLQGKWRDGTPLTTGGVGYNPGSTNFEDHVFPGNPSDPQAWTMCTANISFGDRRMVSSHGPFDFAAGDTFRIQVAFTTHPDIPHPCPNVFALVKPAVTQISQWKNDGALDVNTDLGQVVHLPQGQSITLDPGAIPGATYQWSTGANQATIVVNQPGNYSVTVTPATGCQVVENVLVQLQSSSTEPSPALAWNMQPNPAKEFVVVECAECPDGTVQAVVRNAQGVAMVHTTDQNRQFRLNLPHLPTGFYWLELWQGGRFLGSKKLVLAEDR